MRILLLNLYYPPDTSATAKMAATVADALSARHEVTVLCGRPSYDPTERRGWRLWRTEQTGAVKTVRVGSTDFPRFQMKRRVLNYLSYAALAIPLALFVKCDIVLAMTDPPFEGIVGAIVALLKDKPYVYDINDLYPDMASAAGIVKLGFFVRFWGTLHRWSLRRATRVVALGEDMRARIIAKGIDAARIEVIRTGAPIPPTDGQQACLDPDVIRMIRSDSKFVLLHAGNLGFYGAWETLIAAARSLEQDGVSLVFVGSGAQRERVEALAKNANNVRLLPFFPANKVASVLAAPDAHVITIKRDLEGVVVPSKMYDIVAAGKPIIAVAPAGADVVAIGVRSGFAVSADPDSPDSVVSAVRSLLGEKAKLQDLAHAALMASRGYNRDHELQKFLRVVAEAGNK